MMAVRIESLFSVSVWAFGFFQLNIWALKPVNAENKMKKKNSFLTNVHRNWV
ncbi:hypothetical protein FIC_00721 [Flavobacteriaceae bacterium 3519-10]|nr:hypothetical protein FIC_00721 [Flavobacteriaceae bacterium 3519-10]